MNFFSPHFLHFVLHMRWEGSDRFGITPPRCLAVCESAVRLVDVTSCCMCGDKLALALHWNSSALSKALCLKSWSPCSFHRVVSGFFLQSSHHFTTITYWLILSKHADVWYSFNVCFRRDKKCCLDKGTRTRWGRWKLNSSFFADISHLDFWGQIVMCCFGSKALNIYLNTFKI